MGWGPEAGPGWGERASRCEPAQCAHPHMAHRARSQATHALLSARRMRCTHTISQTHSLLQPAHVTCGRRSVHFLFLRPDRLKPQRLTQDRIINVNFF